MSLKALGVHEFSNNFSSGIYV